MGLSKTWATINNLMCRKTIVQGTSYLTSKSTPFHLSPFVWSYLCSKFKKKLVVHHYTRRIWKVILKHGLTVEYGHIRFDTTDEFKHLEDVVGENIQFGVEKPPVTKRMRNMSVLCPNNTCHIICPSDAQADFSKSSPFNGGINILFNNIDGVNILTNTSQAEHIPGINNFLTAQQAEPPATAHAWGLIDNATVEDVTIVPNCTTCTFLQRVWYAVEVKSDHLVCKVLQSRNDQYLCGQIYRLNNIQSVKEASLSMTQRI